MKCLCGGQYLVSVCSCCISVITFLISRPDADTKNQYPVGAYTIATKTYEIDHVDYKLICADVYAFHEENHIN